MNDQHIYHILNQNCALKKNQNCALEKQSLESSVRIETVIDMLLKASSENLSNLSLLHETPTPIDADTNIDGDIFIDADDFIDIDSNVDVNVDIDANTLSTFTKEKSFNKLLINSQPNNPLLSLSDSIMFSPNNNNTAIRRTASAPAIYNKKEINIHQHRINSLKKESELISNDIDLITLKKDLDKLFIDRPKGFGFPNQQNVGQEASRIPLDRSNLNEIDLNNLIELDNKTVSNFSFNLWDRLFGNDPNEITIKKINNKNNKTIDKILIRYDLNSDIFDEGENTDIADDKKEDIKNNNEYKDFCRCGCDCRKMNQYDYMCLAPAQSKKIMDEKEKQYKTIKYCKHFASCKLANTTCRPSNIIIHKY